MIEPSVVKSSRVGELSFSSPRSLLLVLFFLKGSAMMDETRESLEKCVTRFGRQSYVYIYLCCAVPEEEKDALSQWGARIPIGSVVVVVPFVI